MTPERRRRLLSWAAPAAGAVIFLVAVYYTDFTLVRANGSRVAIAFLCAVAASGAWHLARTWAWSRCFPRPRPIAFGRLARVRLAAEAFSYLTLRGITGEPLKVLLLSDEVDPHEATAAIALERLAYMVGTTLIVGIGSLIAIQMLPLSPLWFRVFRAFAITSGVVGLLSILIVTGRGTYLLAGLRRIDRLFHTRIGEGRVARFAGDVERRLLDLVRANALRLTMLVAATLAAYICMAAEAWLILRVMGVPISVSGALTIETFSRVASFASAFIPANLGALEASSLAAAAAVGAASAGAPLALARRLRGLFWAGVGLAIYPRRGRSSLAVTRTILNRPQGPGRPTLLYLPLDRAVHVSPFARVAGLPIAERVLHTAFRAGYGRVIVLVDETIEAAMRRSARDIRGEIRTVRAAEWGEIIASLPTGAVVTAIGSGTVVSPALLEDAASAEEPDDICDVAAGSDWPISGVLRVNPEYAANLADLSRQLHVRLTTGTQLPSGGDISHARGRLALRILKDGDLAAAEHTICRASYKPTDNKLARFNRRMSLPISIALIRTPLTASQLSVMLVALGLYSAWLFSLGRYGASILAAFLSLAASVLDGCDGEIARLKYQESALGCWIETIGDYSYYIAIFVGMTIGSVRFTRMPIFYWVGAVALAGILISFAFLIYLRSRITAGQPERLHAIAKARFKAEPTAWSRLMWKISFVATRSAMPYGILALSLVGLIPLVVVLAAIGSNTYWISMVLKFKHLMGHDATETVAA